MITRSNTQILTPVEKLRINHRNVADEVRSSERSGAIFSIKDVQVIRLLSLSFLCF